MGFNTRRRGGNNQTKKKQIRICGNNGQNNTRINNGTDCMIPTERQINPEKRKGILTMFEGFKNLQYISRLIFIKKNTGERFFKVRFSKNSETIYGMIKITSPIEDYYSNNIIYEYIVGLFLNQYIEYVPNFFQTYQLMHYNERQLYSSMVKFNSMVQYNKKPPIGINLHDIRDDLLTKLIPLDYESILTDSQKLRELITNSCSKNKIGIGIGNTNGTVDINDSYTYALLTEFSKPVFTIDKFLKDTFFKNKLLIYILFQVYFALYKMYEIFAHYDLSPENVLLCVPYYKGYIEYHYHLNDGTDITFNSIYLVKIINYGNSYIKNVTEEVKKYIDEIKCENSGYSFDDSFHKDNYMDYQNINVSHDLRLLYTINKHINIKKGIVSTFVNTTKRMFKNKNILLRILDKLIYNQGITNNEYVIKSNPIEGYPKTINNVKDAFKFLKDGVIKSELSQKYVPSTYVKKATIHIYESLDKKYEFIEEPIQPLNQNMKKSNQPLSQPLNQNMKKSNQPLSQPIQQ